ncbi:MAG: hypothetical protein ACRCT6_05900, partial [Notoacmeibacter sp.]
MTNYPYVDIAVMEMIRRPFAAGDAMVIVSADLTQVVWANGSGLELFGLGRLDSALNGDAALDDIQRRQITGIVPATNEERVVHLRFVQGPQTVLLPVHVSLMSMPDGIAAVLLRIPARSLKNRTQATDTLDAIRNAGSHAAFIKPGARLISGADDLAALEIDPEDLARMLREVSGEKDRLVKRQLQTARGELPAALARLTDEDGLHLLVVIDPEELSALTTNAEAEANSESEMTALIEEAALSAPTSGEQILEESNSIQEPVLVEPAMVEPTISSFWVDEPEAAETESVPEASEAEIEP